MTDTRVALARPETTLPAASDWQTMLQMAEMFVKGGLVPSSIKTAAAAVTVIQKGRELGFPPMYALEHIAVVNGKPSLDAQAMAACIERDYGPLALIVEETDRQAATVSYIKPGWDARRRLTYTLQDAQTAQLTGKDTWKKHPREMLMWRAISSVARMAFPASISGMYTPEELGAVVDVEGHVVDEAEPVTTVRIPDTSGGVIDVDPETGEIIAAPKPLPPANPTGVDWEQQLRDAPDSRQVEYLWRVMKAEHAQTKARKQVMLEQWGRWLLREEADRRDLHVGALVDAMRARGITAYSELDRDIVAELGESLAPVAGPLSDTEYDELVNVDLGVPDRSASKAQDRPGDDEQGKA